MSASKHNRSTALELRHVSSPSSHQNATDSNVMEISRAADAEIPPTRYRWVLVGACAIIAWWFVGTTYSWGVIQGALVEQGLAPPSTLSFVGSLTVACIALFALVNAKVVRILGLQLSGLLGISLLGIGEICSGFATKSVVGMFFATGLLMGIGTSICFMVISTAPAQYFGAKRGLANGIVYAGGGLGGAIISIVLDSLIQKLGIPWTFWVLGVLTLITGIPAAWLVKQRIPIRHTAMIDQSLFRDSGFILLFVACALATFPLFVPPFFLPIYARGLSLSSSTGAALVSGFNFSSAVGRVLCGTMCDSAGPINTLLLSLLLSAVSMLAIWPVSRSIGPLIIFTVINGAANGGFFSTIPTVAGNTFGSARVSVVMGMIVTGWVGGYLMGAPIAGYLLVAYGGEDRGLEAFRPAIYYAGSMTLASLGLVTLVRLRSTTKLFAKL